MKINKEINNFKYIKNYSSESQEATILLYDTIGNVEDEDGNVKIGINGKEFANELLFLQDKVQIINVRINSGGGNIIDGFSIIAAIKNSPTFICTYNDGLAASIAGLILVAGDERYGFDYSVTMLHNPSGGESDDALNKIKESLVVILENNSILNKEQLNLLMNEETYFNAEEAKQANLIDTIIQSGRKVKLESSNVNEMVNMFNNIIKEEDMKKKPLINKLGVESPESLTNDAFGTESSDPAKKDPALEPEKVSEIKDELEQEEFVGNKDETKEDTIISKLKKDFIGNDEMSDDDFYDAIMKHKADHEQLMADYDDKSKKLEDMVKEAKSAHKAKIDAMVNNLVSTKKISSDEVAKVTKLAEVDFETTKNLFTKINGGKSVSISNTISKSNTIDSTKEGWNIRDYEKNDPKALEKIMKENPVLYTNMVKEFYNK